MLCVKGRKRRYTVVFILGCIGAALNVLCAFTIKGVSLPWLITACELVTWGVVGVTARMAEVFFSLYEGLLCFTNLPRGEVLMYDRLGERRLLEEDFYQAFPMMK